MRIVAESASGPARFCNARCVFLCHRSDTAWQSRTGGAGSAAGGRFSTSQRMPGGLPVQGYGLRAAGSVPRVGEGSTHVRMIQGGWRECGVRADWWGEIEQGWGLVGRARGRVGQGRERVAREGDAFFGVRGREWIGVGRGGEAAVRVGVYGGRWLSNMANVRAMAVDSELGAAAGTRPGVAPTCRLREHLAPLGCRN